MASASSTWMPSVCLRPSRRKAQCMFLRTSFQTSGSRHLSITPPRRQDGVINTAERPRWSYTPEAMKAPNWRRRTNIALWKVNDDPDKLDRMYNRMLGNGGAKMLTDEVKWLAVTHKSFDQGRRGYNDRLAFMGRRIVMLQASYAIINSRASQDQAESQSDDPYGRTPYRHPALDGIDALTERALFRIVDKEHLGRLAQKYGITGVMRWLPKKADNLEGSGITTVATESLYAIVGAVALQQGGELAAKVTRERVLSPLGIFDHPANSF